jgi:flagellar biosynthesis anti-sigma factor FlgM
MAQSKSSTTSSNVLQLEDIRNKKKKSTSTTKKPVHSRNVDKNHTLEAGFEKQAHPPGKLDETDLASKSNAVTPDADSEVINTPAKRSLVSNRRFDKMKVERIKSELADGSYEVDFLRLADKFIEHERFS